MGRGNHSTGERKWKQISEKERYRIETLLRQGFSSAAIGAALEPNRDRRTIEREIARGTVTRKRLNQSGSKDPAQPLYVVEEIYFADAGQRVAEANAAHKGRGLKIGHDYALARHLEKRIGEDGFSPDAAIGEIRAKGMAFKVTLCTKTVYNMIERGDFLNLTNKDLPVKKGGKKRKYRKIRQVALNNLKGRSIEERPGEVEAREEIGHWEMDLVVGRTKACLLVLTERKSRREMVFKLPNKTQGAVNAVLDRLERRYGKHFKDIFKSITMDNGSEFLDMNGLEGSVIQKGKRRTICYYAHPYSAWERGSNENANRLIRRFVPKGTDIGKLTNKDIRRIEQWMNNYPRRMFGYRTAREVYEAA